MRKKLKWTETKNNLVADGGEVGRYEIKFKDGAHLTLFIGEKAEYVGKFSTIDDAKLGAQENWDMSDPPGKLHGLPMFLRITPEDSKARKQWWIDHPPAPAVQMPKYVRPQADAKLAAKEQAKVAKPARTPRASRDGLVSVGDIAKELGVHPREARGVLRAKVKKPDAGWAFPPDQVASIKGVITQGLKKNADNRSGEKRSARGASTKPGPKDADDHSKRDTAKSAGDAKSNHARTRKAGGKSSSAKRPGKKK